MEYLVTIILAALEMVVTIVTVIVTNNKSQYSMNAKLDKSIAVQETKLDSLTSEVREHNNFARRMPVIEEQIKVINHRLEDLERRVD